MNRTALVFAAVAACLSSGFAQTTNNPPGVDPFVLNGLSFSGSVGRVAATVSGINEFLSIDTSYEGGVGSAAGTESPGSVGLVVMSVQNSTISNQQTEVYAIQGGDGGFAESTTSGSGGRASALGGAGLTFNTINPASFVPGSEQFNISGALVKGGAGGAVEGQTGNFLDASGGSALTAANGWLNFNKGELIGGDGGTITAVGASSTANGGHGLLTNFDVAIRSVDGNVSAKGGKGGTINSSGGGNASGGTGFFHQGFNLDAVPLGFTFDISGGRYEGGQGGLIVGPNGTVTGGDGFYMNAQDAIVSGGSFIGGAGGTVSNSTGTVSADGGRGMIVGGFPGGAMILEITGGTFVGGAAGMAGGVAGNQGAALHAIDADTTISGGTFNGAVKIESSFVGSRLDISGGNFDDIQFLPNAGFMNNISISDGTFGDAYFDGAGVNYATNVTGGNFANLVFQGTGENHLVMTGGSIADIYLSETAKNTISLGAAVSGSGNVMLSSGETDFNEWNDSHFVNTSVSNGVMNFNNQDFNLLSGSSFLLQSQNSEANFSDSLFVRDGAMLDVGLGQVTASNFVAESGSELFTTFSDNGSGVTNGLIKGESLTFHSGLTWTLVNDGSATNGLDDFVLATASSASNAIAETLTADDVVLLGNTEWLLGINDVTNYTRGGIDSLVATYGVQDLVTAIDAEGELAKAMEDLDKLMTPELEATLRSWGSSQELAYYNMENGYVRTPEVASSLIGQQAIFSSHIQDRTRSFRMLEKWGTSGRGPKGTAGPSEWYDNTKEWLEDRLPSLDPRPTADAIDEAAPRPPSIKDNREVGKPHIMAKGDNDYDAALDAVAEALPSAGADKIELPETYQVWGRGYGSRIEQKATVGHVGYDADIAGAMLGIDKRSDNILVGVGAGFARTTLNGNSGNDADADTGHAVAYFSANSDKLYVDAHVNYAFSSVDTEGIRALGYEGEFDANTIGLYLGAGLGLAMFNDAIVLTPEASILSTFYGRESYTETSSLGFADKDWESYDEWSHLSSVGATLSLIRHIEYFNVEMEFQPELRAHWLHEFNEEMDEETYAMAGVPGGAQDILVSLQAREEDLVKVGAGLRFSKWDSDITEFGVDLDGVFGDDYTAYVLSGKIMHRF